ncbi:MAG: SGNH/GDSL hydrolase family protein [Bdellovibrionaceae bacterium]|nr:SGNH/GDSL hydrolase family protein [Pseudobdellovibrionaceae bacterium]
MILKVFFIFICLFLINCGQGGGKLSIKNSGGHKNPKIKHSKPNFNGPIVLFGDDFALGTGSTSSEYSLSGCLNNITNKIILSSGKAGQTTHAAIEHAENILNLNPSAIIVSLGIYDLFESVKTPKLSEAETLRNLKNIYSILLKSKALIVHLGIIPPWNEHRLTKIKNLAIQNGVLYSDSGMTPFWNNPWYMEDNYHPNNLGYSIICKNLIRSMKPHFIF